MRVHPLVQDIVESLTVIGGNLRRYKRKLTIQQGEIEKLINDIERIERFISKREIELREMINGEIECEKKKGEGGRNSES
jgi:hypothetical protein